MCDFLKTENLLDISHTLASPLLKEYKYPWEILDNLSEFIIAVGNSLSEERYVKTGENIWVAKNADIAQTASLCGPLIVGENAQIRHCAFIRGSAIIGEGAVIGNSCELKNCVIFDTAQIPHFNYIGDSVIGYKAHLGAGAVTSNLKSDRTEVTIKTADGKVKTGRIKFGAIVGDYAEIGCNSVLNPGSVIGKGSTVYPLSCVRGYVTGNSIYKNKNEIVNKE